MNELTKFLVESVIGTEFDKPKTSVALFGGGFKPPTKGHLEVVNQGIKQNPEVSKVKILVGGGERNGCTQDQAVKIWNLYNDIGFIDKPATIIPVSSPFTYYKNYLKDNPDDQVYIFIGSRPDDKKDQMDVKQRSEFVKKYSDNVIPVEISTGGGVSGTMARKLFKTDLNGFRNMFPENLLDQDFDKILDILNNKSTNTTQKPASTKTEPLSPLNEDPKKGTGKKPKGSSRRLYTDEDPKDTVGIKFSTRQDIVDTLNKKSFKAKSHARQSQIINLIHQRVRAAYGRAKDPAVKKRLKTGLDYITKKKEASKKKTQRLKKQKLNEVLDPINFDFNPLIQSLTKSMENDGLQLKPYPKVKFIHTDFKNADNFFGKTAYYNPNTNEVVLYTLGRHPKDILRSYAHELVHVHQNHEDRLNNIETDNVNADSELEQIEREAYETGNIMFRSWTNKDPFGLAEAIFEIAEDENYYIYLDMDGVVADFDKRFEDLSGMMPQAYVDKNGLDAFWDLIDEKHKVAFWRGIELMPGAEKLVNFVEQYPFEMLTAPSIKKQSVIGKGLWVKDKVGTLYSSKPKVTYRSAKQKHTVKPDLTKFDILIDDKASTIDRWNGAGGTAILYQNADQVINDLKKLGL